MNVGNKEKLNNTEEHCGFYYGKGVGPIVCYLDTCNPFARKLLSFTKIVTLLPLLF